MKNRPSTSFLTHLLCGLLFMGNVLHAQQDLPPGDPAELLKTLQQLKETQKESMKSSLGQARQQIESAAASPSTAMQFYTQAYMATNIVGKSRENTEFRDWKDRADAVIDSSEARKAVQMHLTYLGITLRHAAGVEVKDLLPELIAYASTLFTTDELEGGRNRGVGRLMDDMLGEPLPGSIFVRWFQIGDALEGLEDWEMVPGDADGIAEKIILPELRKVKDPRILKYWDDRIEREQNAATESKLAFRIGRFEKDRKPELLWLRAKEFKEVGMPNRAVSEMIAVVQTYPGHGDAASWIAEIEELLNPSETAMTVEVPAPADDPLEQ